MRVLVIPPALIEQVSQPHHGMLRIAKGSTDVPNMRRHSCYYVLHPFENGRVYHIARSLVDNTDGSLTLELGNSFTLPSGSSFKPQHPALYHYASLRSLGLLQIGPGLLVRLEDGEQGHNLSACFGRAQKANVA